MAERREQRQRPRSASPGCGGRSGPARAARRPRGVVATGVRGARQHGHRSPERRGSLPRSAAEQCRRCASRSRPSPQHTTWPTCSPSGRPPTRSSCSSRLGPSTTSTRSSPRDLPAPAWRAGSRPPRSPRPPRRLRVGRARHGHAVPPPGGAGQHGRDPRHHLGRPARARDRRGLERGRGGGVRHRPARHARGALRRLRRGVRGDHRPALPRARPPSTVATCSSRTRAATPSRSSSRTRRSASAGGGERRTLRSVARFAQHWNFPGGSVEQFVGQARRAARGTAPTSGAIRRRSRSRRTSGGPARSSRRVVEQAKRYADAGLDLGIVYLPAPHTPDVLDELADAIGAARRLNPASERPARGLALHAGGADGVARRVARRAPTSCRTARRSPRR